MEKEIKVVCGLIYDDKFYARTGRYRFCHLNGDIEINSDGEQVYICSRWNEDTKKFEDEVVLVSTLPNHVQKFIELYTQSVGSDRNAKYIGVNASELV